MAGREQPEPQHTVLNPEEQFRLALDDAVAILRKLAPLCGSVEELVGVAELAMTNDAQLRLLMDRVAPVHFRR